MSKRTNYPRIDKDAYMTTDSRAVTPLFSYLSKTLGKNAEKKKSWIGAKAWDVFWKPYRKRAPDRLWRGWAWAKFPAI